MKYLKKFENHAAYAAAESGLILPNVSLCVQENEVHYNPDPYGGHDYVEIGGVKWATMNVGANSVIDNGLYFQWADAQGYTVSQVGSGEGQKYFGWEDYKYGNGTSSPSDADMTKYNETDGKTVLDAVDDAATVAWGGAWRTPTEGEFNALSAATTSAWTSNYQGTGVSGLVLTDKTDSSKTLFFPASEYCYNGEVDGVGRHGNYWTSVALSGDLTNIHAVYFGDSYILWRYFNRRYYGCTIRPVAD